MKQAITIFDHLHFDNPTTEQRLALQNMADFCKKDNNDDFMILCGAAGTGKTSIVSAFIGYLNAMGIRYLIAAPTGRAARILGRKSKTLSSTIHSLIYLSEVNKKTGVIHCKLKQNLNNRETIYIIDEASMIASQPSDNVESLFKSTNSILQDVVTYVKSGNKRNKVLFLGDRYQLAPIGEKESKALCQTYLEKTFQWKGNTNQLTEIKRQENGSNIMRNAIEARKAMEQGKGHAALFSPKVRNVWAAADDYVEVFKKYGPEHAICITASHGMNKIFNTNARERIFGRNARSIVAGDLMIVTTNWKRNEKYLYNGDHVMVKEILLDQVEEVAGLHFVPIRVSSKSLDGKEEEIEDFLLLESIHSPNGQLGIAIENDLRAKRFATNRHFAETGSPEDDRYVGALRLNYGYAITCNKAQGGEWEKVYINTFKIPDLRFQYTAVTRAKQELCLY